MANKSKWSDGNMVDGGKKALELKSHTNVHTLAPLPRLLGLCLFDCRCANYVLSTACQESRIRNVNNIKRKDTNGFHTECVLQASAPT